MKSETNAVFLFIAELTGSFVPGSGDVECKTKCGQKDYITNHLPPLDLNDEEDRKDLHEVVWLERMYEELDGYFNIGHLEPEIQHLSRGLSINAERYRTESYRWTVPIELDCSASMLQHMGALLGDLRLLEMTNVLGSTLQDPWKLDGMSRAMLKAAATPMLYASSQQCYELWQDNKMEYTADHVNLYNNEMANGAFGLANLFKEFIINNAKPQATMTVKVWNDEFEIECNRFRNVGEKTKAYKIWDSIDECYNVLLHTDTKKVPDLERFRRYFVTLLIHGIDSQVADRITRKVQAKYGWVIPIHDAWVVSPAAAADVRKWYAECITEIYVNRKQILSDYFTSIGITEAAREQWDALQNRVQPVNSFNANPMAVK